MPSDYTLQGKCARLRLLEKGNKEKLVWSQRVAAAMFETLDKNHRLSGLPIIRRDMLRIVKERCAAAKLPETICNHTFRGMGITVFSAERRRAGSRPGHGKSFRPAHNEAL